MNISKVTTVIISDETGKVVDRFEIKMASIITMRDKTKILELRKEKKQ